MKNSTSPNGSRRYHLSIEIPAFWKSKRLIAKKCQQKLSHTIGRLNRLKCPKSWFMHPLSLRNHLHNGFQMRKFSKQSRKLALDRTFSPKGTTAISKHSLYLVLTSALTGIMPWISWLFLGHRHDSFSNVSMGDVVHPVITKHHHYRKFIWISFWKYFRE